MKALVASCEELMNSRSESSAPTIYTAACFGLAQLSGADVGTEDIFHDICKTFENEYQAIEKVGWNQLGVLPKHTPWSSVHVWPVFDSLCIHSAIISESGKQKVDSECAWCLSKGICVCMFQTVLEKLECEGGVLQGKSISHTHPCPSIISPLLLNNVA